VCVLQRRHHDLLDLVQALTFPGPGASSE
jgi:hypothetical protein